MRIATSVACWMLAIVIASADDPVEFHLKDGRVIVGEIADFADGAYLVRSGAETIKVAERDLRTITPVAESPAPEGPLTAGDAANDPRSSEAHQALEAGLAALEASRPADARPSLQKARELDPWSLAARFALATACEQCNDAEATERELRQVLVIDPANRRARIALVVLYERTGQHEKRDAAIEEGFRLQYPSAEAEYRAARHFLKTGDLDRARAHWTRYLAARPDPRPAWDVESHLEQDAESLAASGQRQAAIQRLYDLMQHNPLERERALSRVLAIHEDSVSAYLAQHDVSHAWEELAVMATVDPARASAYERRSTAVCVEEASRCVRDGEPARLREMLAWFAARLPAPEAGGALTAALAGDAITGDDPRGARVDALFVLREFLADHPDPAYGSVRERLVAALSAFADQEEAAGRNDHVVRIAEALRETDTDRADAWKARLARAHRAAGLAAMDAHDYALAIEHLGAAASLLPEDATLPQALEDAQFYRLRASLAGPGDSSAKEDLIASFLDKTKDPSHAEWGRKELERVKTISQACVADASRDSERYFPLAQGACWRYESTDGCRDTMKVVSRTKEGSWTRAEVEVESTTNAGASVGTNTIFLSDTEAYREREGRKEVWLRFPISTGLSWEDGGGRMTYRRTYLSTHETVETKMGTFHDCLRVQYESIDAEGGTLSSELYYAPWVGLVKVVTPGGKGMEIVEFQQPDASAPAKAGPAADPSGGK